METIKNRLTTLTLFVVMIIANYGCESESSNEIDDIIENKDLSELIIGTWQVYDIKILDKEKNELDLPEYLSIECAAQTKYIFSVGGEFEISNSKTYQEYYNSQNELEGYECVPNTEGGGFDSGTWKIKTENDGKEFLDLDWLYKEGTTRTDGTLWKPEFLTEKAFLISEFDDYEEQYFNSYLRKTN